LILYDPQTSGGLLVAVDAAAEAAAVSAFRRAGVDAVRIGRVVPEIPGVSVDMV